MVRFLFWRMVQSIIVLWAVYTVTFVLLMCAPGDPFLGDKQNLSPALRQAVAKKYGLEYLAASPEERKKLTTAARTAGIAKAYFFYARAALRMDFGKSIEYDGWDVTDIIRASLPISITLGAAALLIALWSGVAAGMLGASHKGKVLDLILSVVSLLGVSLPTFVLGSLLLMVFVLFLPILPSGGWGTPRQIILPAMTLSLFYLAFIARLTRASTFDVLSADYVRTARAKGLPASRVMIRHVGANAALPVLSYLGPAAASILVGSFVVEKLFAIPGLGSYFVNACLNNDIPLVLGTVIVYTAMVVVFNILVDIAYAAIDPRITLQ